LYEINPNDLIIIEAIINNKLNDDKKDKEDSLKNLYNIANENNLEALYKYTCLIQKEKNKEETEKRFQLLIYKKYYRSYIDNALYLNENKRYKEALEILKIARNNNAIPAGLLYYDIFLNNIDFSLLMIEAVNSSFSQKCELYNLIQILIDDILTESFYSFFEFIFFRKIITKHYNLEEQFNNYFLEYTKEIAQFLIKITYEPNFNKRKKIILKFFCNKSNNNNNNNESNSLDLKEKDYLNDYTLISAILNLIELNHNNFYLFSKKIILKMNKNYNKRKKTLKKYKIIEENEYYFIFGLISQFKNNNDNK